MIKAISLFSGAGGMDVGFKNAGVDVVLANDPDADRLGIYAKDTKTGEYMTYTGNMSALLIAEYRISQMKEKGILKADGMFITTIV